MTARIRKAVITAAGLGTRLLPNTKEIPKEMLPVFDLDPNGSLCLKPVIHKVFETLYEAGIREFCFIVGRGKRAIEDYFTPDPLFLHLVREKRLEERALALERFYNMILDSKIYFINQPVPRGFGDAVLTAEGFVGGEPFILHAGDDVVLSRGNDHVKRLLEVYGEYGGDVVLLAEEVEDPRAYGVIVPEPVGGRGDVVRIADIVEKPREPPSNLAVIGIYVLHPRIFDVLRRTEPDEKGELQLTDGIRLMLREGGRGYALLLRRGEKRLDVGTPHSYYRAITESYRYYSGVRGGLEGRLGNRSRLRGP